MAEWGGFRPHVISCPTLQLLGSPLLSRMSCPHKQQAWGPEGLEPRKAGSQWRGLVGRRGHVVGHPLGPELRETDLREGPDGEDRSGRRKGCVL